MAAPKSVEILFELTDDDFPHGWFFNKYRIERVGSSLLVTLALVTETGVLASNAVVLSDSDLKNNEQRAMDFLGQAGDISQGLGARLLLSATPARVYPVNHFNLSRVDQAAEIGFFRFSISSAADAVRQIKHQGTKKSSVKCYPVVMFRCDFGTQIALLKDLYARQST